MRCPFCSHPDTSVVDSRISDVEVRRRRECERCDKRFTTYEKAELELRILKKDGRRELFDRTKIKLGLLKACHKRPISEEQVDAVVSKVEQKIHRLGREEVASTIIGSIAMKELLKLDQVAYVRFASVCKAFDDPQLFEKELELLKD